MSSKQTVVEAESGHVQLTSSQSIIPFPDVNAAVDEVRAWLRYWFDSRRLPVPEAAINQVAWTGKALYRMSEPGLYMEDLISWGIPSSYARMICGQVKEERSSKVRPLIKDDADGMQTNGVKQPKLWHVLAVLVLLLCMWIRGGKGGRGRRKEERGRRKEERGRRKEEGGKRKEERGRRKEEGGKRKEERGKRKEERGKRKEERGRMQTFTQILNTRVFCNMAFFKKTLYGVSYVNNV
ncbi:hypothetical protein DL98DRAFT_574425 [Cadophora sp. DSE1049]|nr:hypothetical protein DL98DRAFT_574425 [Cadophora sp. DSE1049]